MVWGSFYFYFRRRHLGHCALDYSGGDSECWQNWCPIPEALLFDTRVAEQTSPLDRVLVPQDFEFYLIDKSENALSQA